MPCDEVLTTLKRLGSPRNVEGMARFGIRPAAALGVPKPALRRLAKDLGKDHGLAAELWASQVHDAMVLASMIDDPREVAVAQAQQWASEFDNWDICDQCCMNLFRKTGFAHQQAQGWSASDREFMKRAGFVLMACLAVHDKTSGDAVFERYLSIVKREATDNRNFVRKAVNWALRQIGKRNDSLREKAIEVALDLSQAESRSARWIGADALRELSGKAVRDRVNLRRAKRH